MIDTRQHGYEPGVSGKVWKAVRKVTAYGPWKSGWAPSPGRVFYIPNVKVLRPEGQGPLASFCTKKAAEDFISGAIQIAREAHYLFGVFEAEATISQDKALWTYGSKQDWFDQFPSTTVLCDDITLRELVRSYCCMCGQCRGLQKDAQFMLGKESTEY